MSNTLAPYYGEFLTSPMPLELSLVEPCDYGCNYCFAVLNDRYWAEKKGKSVNAANLKSVMTLLRDFRERKTLEAALLRHSVPILLSNRTDPFGRANRAASLPMLRLLRELELPVAIQTKGFTKREDFAEVMDILDYPTCWYISIASLNEDYRAQVEPGAPSIAHRLELIEKLRERGHEVVVGINPCVPEWNDDPQKLCQAIVNRGAWGVWIEALHLSRDQRNQLRPKEKANLGDEVILRASMTRREHPIDLEHCHYTRSCAQEVGLEPFSMGQDIPSKFFDIYHNCYEHTFPTAQDFLNVCFEELEDGSLISFEDWASLMLPSFPEGVLSVGHYLGATSRAFTQKMKGQWTNYMTYEALLKLVWANREIPTCLVNHPCFSFAVQREGQELVQWTDEQDLPLLAFHSKGWNNFYVDVDRVEPYLSA